MDLDFSLILTFQVRPVIEREDGPLGLLDSSFIYGSTLNIRNIILHSHLMIRLPWKKLATHLLPIPQL